MKCNFQNMTSIILLIHSLDGELDTLTGWRSKTRARMSKLEGWSTEKNKNYEKLRVDLIASLRI